MRVDRRRGPAAGLWEVNHAGAAAARVLYQAFAPLLSGIAARLVAVESLAGRVARAPSADLKRFVLLNNNI